MPNIEQRGSHWRVRVMVRGRRLTKTFGSRSLAEAWAARQAAVVAGIPSLRDALSDHRIASVIPRRFKEAAAAANYAPDEIIASSFPVPSQCGIYFLIRDGEIRYIGQTKTLLYRLSQHSRAGRQFDAFSFIPCREDQLDELEKVYVTLLMPEENRQFGG